MRIRQCQCHTAVCDSNLLEEPSLSFLDQCFPLISVQHYPTCTLPLQKHFLMSCLHCREISQLRRFFVATRSNFFLHQVRGHKEAYRQPAGFTGVSRPAGTAVPGSLALHRAPQNCAWSRAFHGAAGHQGCKAPKCSHGPSPGHATAMQKLNVSVSGQYQRTIMFATNLRGKGKLPLMINRQYQVVVPLMLL